MRAATGGREGPRTGRASDRREMPQIDTVSRHVDPGLSARTAAAERESRSREPDGAEPLRDRSPVRKNHLHDVRLRDTGDAADQDAGDCPRSTIGGPPSTCGDRGNARQPTSKSPDNDGHGRKRSLHADRAFLSRRRLRRCSTDALFVGRNRGPEADRQLLIRQSREEVDLILEIRKCPGLEQLVLLLGGGRGGRSLCGSGRDQSDRQCEHSRRSERGSESSSVLHTPRKSAPIGFLKRDQE